MNEQQRKLQLDEVSLALLLTMAPDFMGVYGCSKDEERRTEDINILVDTCQQMAARYVFVCERRPDLNIVPH